MLSRDFSNLCKIVKARSGLHLTGNHMPMVTSRLTPIAQRLGHRNVQDFLARLRHDSSEGIIGQVIDALTTHETSFFRDHAQFETLRNDIIPKLMRRRSHEKSIRILSAACSYGQEAYTLAILATELGLAEKGWAIEIIATDYSELALARAKQARYSLFELQRGLDETIIARHFTRSGDDYTPKASLRGMIAFRKHNLLDGAGSLGEFDIVFCRNVLFYFDVPSKTAALTTLCAMTADDGVLVLANTEAAIGEMHGLVPHTRQRGIFRMPGITSRPRFAQTMHA